MIYERGKQPFPRIDSTRVFKFVSSSQNFRYAQTKARYSLDINWNTPQMINETGCLF